MNTEKTKKFITDYWHEISKYNDKFSSALNAVFDKYSTKEVNEKINGIKKPPEFEIISVEKISDDEEIYEVTTKGMIYTVDANENCQIIDVSQICICVQEELPGKCVMCGGHGHLHTEDGEVVECPECEGSGVCAFCGGSEVMSIADISEEIVESEDLELMQKMEVEEKDSFMNFLKSIKFEDKIPTEILEIVSNMRYTIDTVQYEVFKGVLEVYKKYFDTDNFKYSHFMFPIFEAIEIGQIMEIPNDGYFCEFITSNEELGLKFNKNNSGKYVITAVDLPCPILEENPELHEEPLECDCADENNGNPDPNCEMCFGTGIIVCPMCFGEGWVPFAPKELNFDDNSIKEHYIKGVKEIYSEEN